MKCPLCQADLVLVNGSPINPNDGVTLYCPNQQCPAQEVFGHGANENRAFEVIQEKYKPIAYDNL